MMSPAGMDNFRKQLMQLVGSIRFINSRKFSLELVQLLET